MITPVHLIFFEYILNKYAYTHCSTWLCICSESYFYPLTALDVVCHEVGHAITQWHGGNMEYQYQSGGMNEAYSDVVGKCACTFYSSYTKTYNSN